MINHIIIYELTQVFYNNLIICWQEILELFFRITVLEIWNNFLLKVEK